MRPFLATALMLALSAACAGPSDRVVVAAGTTLVDSGMLDRIVDDYESTHPGVQVSVVGEATARALELGRRGGADLLITHAPELEAEFVEDGLAADYRAVLESRFALVGPPERVERLSGEVRASLGTIASRGWAFASRADGSGTHHKELELWASAGIDPLGQPWYLETGQGMGLTLQVADQRRAFTLSELGAYLAAADILSLEAVGLTRDPLLANPYHLIVVAGAQSEAAAMAFAEWIGSAEGTASIIAANRFLFGDLVYRPVTMAGSGAGDV